MDELYPSLRTLCEELKSTPRLVLAPSDAVPAERAVGAFFRAATSAEDIDLDGLDAEQVWAVVGGGVVDLPPELADPGRPKNVFEEDAAGGEDEDEDEDEDGDEDEGEDDDEDGDEDGDEDEDEGEDDDEDGDED